MPFTDFCCRSGGSNLNAGTRTGNSTEPGTSASFTYASGNWDGTSVFTVASGNPSTDGVAVGDYASVYADGSTVTGYVGRVTAVSSTTITVSGTFKGGTAPTSGTGNRTLKIGGAWAGPSGASPFPFNIFAHAMRNASDDVPRLNLKNDQTYSISAGLGSINGQTVLQGYTSSYGDGGRAVIDGGTSGTSYVVASLSNIVCDVEFKNNGATGSSQMINAASTLICFRCVFRDCRGDGVRVSANAKFIECEFYGCNQSNTSDIGALTNNTGTVEAIRCCIHDNTGANVLGVRLGSGNGTLINCVIESNGGDGVGVRAQSATIVGCDIYNNGGNGINVNPSSSFAQVDIENCNLVKNTLYGIRGTTATWAAGRIINNGFGSGTQANGSGTTTGLGSMVESGSVTYASGVTPWTDPANGDFRINLAAAKAAGRGSFLQTATSYSGAVGYPDIGAAQSQAIASGGGSLINSQQLVRQGWIG